MMWGRIITRESGVVLPLKLGENSLCSRCQRRVAFYNQRFGHALKLGAAACLRGSNGRLRTNLI